MRSDFTNTILVSGNSISLTNVIPLISGVVIGAMIAIMTVVGRLQACAIGLQACISIDRPVLANRGVGLGTSEYSTVLHRTRIVQEAIPYCILPFYSSASTTTTHHLVPFVEWGKKTCGLFRGYSCPDP